MLIGGGRELTRGLLTWSRTQNTVSLSSAESEYYAITSGAVEAMGIANFLGELGYVVKIALLTDSKAAYQCILKGVGSKMKHIQLRRQFMHQLVREKVVYLMKMDGTKNLADILTKYVTAAVLHALVSGGGLVLEVSAGVCCVLGGLEERTRECERSDRQERSEHELSPSSFLSLSATPSPLMHNTQATIMTTDKPHHFPSSLPTRASQPWPGPSADDVFEFGGVIGRMATRIVGREHDKQGVVDDYNPGNEVHGHMKDTGYKAVGLRWQPTLNYLGLMLATRVGPSLGHELVKTSSEQPEPTGFSLCILLLVATVFGWWLRGLIGTRLQRISACRPLSGWINFLGAVTP